MLLQRKLFISCGSDSNYLITTILLLNCKYPPCGTKNHKAQLYFFKQEYSFVK